MEAVFLDNLLKVTEDLGEDEILFCPMGLWADYIEKGLGGMVEEGDKVRPFSEEEIRLVKEQLFYHKYINSKENFFYVVKPDLMRRDLERVFEELWKNKGYIRKDIFEDLKYLKQVLEYDLFVSLPYVPEEYGNGGGVEVIKSMIEEKVESRLVEEEKKKRELYRNFLEALEYSLNFLRRIGDKWIAKALGKSLEFYINLPERIRNLGIEGYLKESNIYKEAKRQEKRALIFIPLFLSSGKPVEDYMQIVNGVGLKSLFSLSIDKEIEFGKVYLVFGKYKVNVDGREKFCIIGLPLFKIKFSSSSDFRSRNVTIRTKERPKNDIGVMFARLKVKDFTVKVLYEKEPRVLKEGLGKRVVEASENFSLVISLRRREEKSTIGGETYYVGSLHCKICDIEIRKDGSFSTELDYSNMYFISLNDTRGEEKYYPGKRASELIEKLALGKGVKKVGEIIKESSVEKEKVYVLKEDLTNKWDDDMENYLRLSFGEIIKALLPKIRDKVNRGHFVRLELEGEEEKELVEKTQTGFLQSKLNKAIEYLEKIGIEMCFSSIDSIDGKRYPILITHPELREPEKMVEEIDLYRKIVDKGGLRGEKKNIEAVLRLVSYSYPLLNPSAIEKLMEELKDGVRSFLIRNKVPVEEVEITIEHLVPQASPYDPGTFMLFLSEEEGVVKVYTNAGKMEGVLNNLRVRMGNLEIEV